MKKRNKVTTILGGMALCLLLGLSGAPKAHASDSALVLGNPDWKTETNFHLSELTINSNAQIKTVIVSMSAGQLIEPKVTSGMTINKNLTSDMYTFTYRDKQTPAAVQAFLKTLEFKYAAGQQIEIKLDANNTNIPANATITNGANGHYYMYVAYPGDYDSVTNKNEMDWIVAYNSAKNYSYLGMKGYLATITSREEDELLRKISSEGAWSGGTRVLKTDNNKISDINNLSIDMLAKTTQPVNSEEAKKEFYWTCGPEAGQSISKYYTNWNANEPNSMLTSENEYESYLQINYTTTQKWNDLCRTFTNKLVSGYFVEFGGYAQDPGYNSENTGEQIASGSVVVKSFNVNVSNEYGSSASISGLPAAIKSNQELKFKVTQNQGWSIAKENIAIKIGDKVLSGDEYTYDSITGQIVVAGSLVNGDVSITINPSLDWYKKNQGDLNKYLATKAVTKDDLSKLSQLKNEWFTLSGDAQNYIATQTKKTTDDIGNKLNYMTTASNFASKNDTDITTVKGITQITPNTKSELKDAIKSVQDKYNDLGNGPQAYLEDLSVKLNDLNKAQAFCDQYKDIFNTKPIDKNAINTLKNLETNYEKLNDAQKALVKDTYDQLKDKLLASEMLNNHDAIISKTPVINVNDDAEKVIQSVQEALDDYNNLTDEQRDQIDSSVKPDLENKLAAGEWVKGISNILSKEKVNQSDLQKINDSIKSYNELDGAVKGQIDDSIIKKLKDQATAARWLDTHNDILAKDTVDNSDLSAINKAIESYNGLFDGEKSYINSDVIPTLKNKLAAANWSENNKDIIANKGPMKADDINAVKKALSEYDKLEKDEQQFVNPVTVKNLNDKLAVTDMLVKNPILSKDIKDISYEDLADLKNGVKAYDQLTDEQKELVDPATKEIVDTTREAEGWLNNNDAIIKKDNVDKDDLDKINAAIKSYEQLGDNAKKLIDPSILKDLNDKKNASQWSGQYNDILSKDLNDITADDLNDLRDAMDAYNKLSDSEKSKIDNSIIENTIEAQKNAFIEKFLSDQNGEMYDKLTGNNYEQILSGETDWNNMSKSEKDIINEAVKEKMNCTYEDLIADAKKLKESVDNFVDEYLSDEDGNIYKDSNSSNYEQILSGLDSWNEKSQDEKDAVNAILTANGGKTYEELIDAAQAMKDSVDQFISDYVSDKDENIYKDSNNSNYEQILSGLDSWNEKSQDEKDAVNAILTANGGKTYEELIKAAQAMKNSVNQFISDYVSDKDGNIYKDSNSSNYEQILSGLDSWNKMSQDEKDVVNAILTANGGKTYEELIKAAQAMKNSVNQFISDYVSDKDGNIYKDSNSSNYAQILSGLDSWNKMSQDEKNAVNAILTANGGKTYEELLKQANDIKASVKTEDETNMIPLYMLLLSSLLGGYIVIKKRREA